MAEEQPAAKTNGNGAAPAADEPQVSVMAQYVKDLSVENPSAPQVFQWQSQPSLDVQFSLNADKIADDVHEVSLKIEVSARSDNGVHFVIDLTYSGLFAIRGVPDEAIPPFLLEPIDFASIYMAQVQALQEQDAQQGGEAGAAESEPAPKDS